MTSVVCMTPIIVFSSFACNMDKQTFKVCRNIKFVNWNIEDIILYVVISIYVHFTFPSLRKSIRTILESMV